MTPIIPFCIIFKTVWLLMKTNFIVGVDWRKNQKSASASASWMDINILEKRKKNVEGALFHLKIAVASLESFIHI